MAEANASRSLLDLPPAERPLDFRYANVSFSTNRNEIGSIEVTANIIVYFGKNIGQSFTSGECTAISEQLVDSCRRGAFLEAARKTWQKYGQSGNVEKSCFIKNFLIESWQEIADEKSHLSFGEGTIEVKFKK